MYIDDSLTSQKFGDMYVDRRDRGFKRLNTFVYAKNLTESVPWSRLSSRYQERTTLLKENSFLMVHLDRDL